MRKSIVAIALTVFAGIASAQAQTYPSRSITIVVPFPPGFEQFVPSLLEPRLEAQDAGRDAFQVAGNLIGRESTPDRVEVRLRTVGAVASWGWRDVGLSQGHLTSLTFRHLRASRDPSRRSP